MTLIERLESAEQGSRELDGAIRMAVWPGRYELIDVPPDCDGENAGKIWAPKGLLKSGWQFPPKGRMDLYSFVNHSHPSEYYTTDLSAAVALVERALPGWNWSVESARRLCGANVWGFDSDRADAILAQTPALALCTALLKALKTKEPSA